MLKLDSLNMGLQRIGQPEATTLTANRAVRALSSQFKHSLQAVFCSYPWDSYKKQATLTAAGGVTPLFGYTTAYVLPIDFCRLVEEEPTGYKYDRVTGYIYGNDSTFQLSYVAFPYSGDWEAVEDIETVSNWVDLPADNEIFDTIVLTDGMYEVLALHMAYKCCFIITGDRNDAELLEKEYNRALASCKTATSQQKRNMSVEATEWEDARG
jgi:hypothetical protein